jgi:hypothetical protein
MQTVETLVPEIVSTVPMPPQSQRTLPTFKLADQIRIKATTIKVISDLTGEPIVPTEEEQAQAQAVAHEMVTNPAAQPNLNGFPNAAMAYLAGMVANSNCMIVKDLADLKLFVVNNLVQEYDQAQDTKSRLTALKMLGEVDGVDAFKRRTETTHIVKPIEEVEKELLSVLEGIEYQVVADEGGETNG